MKFGINTLLWTAGFDIDHLPLLPQFKQWGFDAVEVARFAFDGFPAQLIRTAAQNEGLDVTFCSALTGDLSLISDDPAIRNRALDFLKQGIQTAAAIGSPVFMGPFIAPVGQLLGRRRTEDEWKRAVEGLHQLIPTLRECDVTLAIEPLNRFETYALTTAAEAKRLCDEIHDPYIGVLFDTFHANIEEKHAGDAIRTLGSHIAHVHTCENDRGIPGTGHVAWAEVFTALHEIGYNDYCVIESFGSTIPEIAAAACIWRDLAPSTDDIARDGVAFLKEAAIRAGYPTPVPAA
jgi:D-psicose/D-tagatose/L-ribulose 3-epimerase